MYNMKNISLCFCNATNHFYRRVSSVPEVSQQLHWVAAKCQISQFLPAEVEESHLSPHKVNLTIVD